MSLRTNDYLLELDMEQRTSKETYQHDKLNILYKSCLLNIEYCWYKICLTLCRKNSYFPHD